MVVCKNQYYFYTNIYNLFAFRSYTIFSVILNVDEQFGTSEEGWISTPNDLKLSAQPGASSPLDCEMTR